MQINREVVSRLQLCRIPVVAGTLTLERERQPLLRAIVLDRSYQSQGLLKSIAIHRPPAMKQKALYRIVVRFAAEMALTGQDLTFASTGSIKRELERYSHGAEHDTALLYRPGFVVVPDLLATPDDVDSSVVDYLVDFTSQGGGVVLAINPDDGCSGEVDGVTNPALASLIESSMQVTAN